MSEKGPKENTGKSVVEIKQGFEKFRNELNVKEGKMIDANQNGEQNKHLITLKEECKFFEIQFNKYVKTYGLHGITEQQAADFGERTDFPVIPETRDLISNLIPGMLKPIPQIQEEIMERGIHDLESWNFREGAGFMQNLVEQNSALFNKMSAENIGVFQALQREISNDVDPNYNQIVILFFIFFRGNMTKVESILKLQTRYYRKEKERKNTDFSLEKHQKSINYLVNHLEEYAQKAGIVCKDEIKEINFENLNNPENYTINNTSAKSFFSKFIKQILKHEKSFAGLDSTIIDQFEKESNTLPPQEAIKNIETKIKITKFILTKAFKEKKWRALGGQNELFPNFFTHTRCFLEIFSDISYQVSQHQILHGKKGHHFEKQISNQSLEALEKIFSHPELFLELKETSLVHEETDKTLFDFLKEEPKLPWMCTSLKNTPFDIDKSQALMSVDVSRNIVAQACIELNEFFHRSNLRQLSQAISTRQGIKSKDQNTSNLDTQIKELLTNINFHYLLNNLEPEDLLSLIKSYFEKELSTLSQMISQRQRVDSRNEDTANVDFDTLLKNLDWETQLKAIKEYLNKSKEQFSPKNHAKTIAVLTRLINPEVVFNNSTAQKQIRSMYQTLNRSNELTDQDFFAKSLEELFADEENKYLDLPLEELEGFDNQSLREIFLELTINNFKKDFILGNSEVNSEREIKYKNNKKAKPIFSTIDKDNLDIDLESIKKKFDLGKIGILRKWTTSIAKAYYQEINQDFSKGLSFATKNIKEYLGNGKEYDFLFSGSGTDVFSKFMAHVPGYFEDKEIIIGQHEYDSIVNLLKTHSKNPDNIKEIQITPQTNPGLSPKEYANKLLSTLDLEKTQMIWISSYSRFGEAFFTFDPNKSNTEYLSEVIAELKPDLQNSERFIAIGIDAAQAVGRTRTKSDLEILKPDLYLFSSQKALGQEGCGIMAIGKDFEQHLVNNEFYLPIERLDTETQTSDKGTQLILNIIATSIALKKRMSTIDLFKIEGNFDDLKEKIDEEKQAIHMAKLIDFTLETIKKYQFINLLHPQHNQKNSYNGFVSFSINDIKNSDLQEKLKEWQYLIEIEEESHVKNACRIAFHYLHTTEDIDMLFTAIKEIHSQIPKKQEKNSGSN